MDALLYFLFNWTWDNPHIAVFMGACALWYIIGFASYIYFDRLPKKWPDTHLGWRPGVVLALFGPIEFFVGAMMEADAVGRPGSYD